MATVRMFSFRIYNIAYKNVQPLLLEIHQQKTNIFLMHLAKMVGIQLFPDRWYLKFSYMNQNMDRNSDRIFFTSKEEALDWYNFIFEAVFLEKSVSPPLPPSKKQPPPPPKKPKPLEKLKKTDPKHLKVVKDDETKDKE